VDEDVAATQSGRVYEVIAEWEILRQILVRSVRSYHTQIVFVLQQRDGEKQGRKKERKKERKSKISIRRDRTEVLKLGRR
jgi:hypothetical protein